MCGVRVKLTHFEFLVKVKIFKENILSPDTFWRSLNFSEKHVHGDENIQDTSEHTLKHLGPSESKVPFGLASVDQFEWRKTDDMVFVVMQYDDYNWIFPVCEVLFILQS